MRFAAFSAFAAMAGMAVTAKDSRSFAILHFISNGIVTTRADPIVNPGGPSPHVHFVQGGSNFGFNSTGESLKSSRCSNALIKGDFSNYWIESLYFRDPKTGKFEPVPPFYMNVYYFFEATNDPIKAFPTGLQIFTGNVSLRTPPSSSATNLDPSQGPIQNVKWTCTRDGNNFDNPPSWPAGSDGTMAGIRDPVNKGEGVGFPDVSCDGYASPLRADIHFPSCYNPKAGLTNYKENMAFPTDAGNGKADCPPGWIHTPHLFYEMYWDTLSFRGRWDENEGTQPFVLSSGDATGYGHHGDFMAAWDEDLLQNIIDHCDAGVQGMDKCPGITELNQDACAIDPLVNEPLGPSLDALPGSNPVTGWQYGNGGSNPPQPAPPSSPSPSPSPSPSTPSSPSPPSSSSHVPLPSPSPSSHSQAPPHPSASSSSPASHSVPSPPPPPPSHLPPSSPTNNQQSSITISTSTVTSFATITVTQSNAPCFPTPSASSSPSDPQSPPPPPPSPTEGQPSPTQGSGPSPSHSQSSPPPPPPTEGQTSPNNGSDYQFVGCFSDQSDRVLTGDTLPNLGPMTNSACIANCMAKDFDLAGTEAGGQCFCGNQLIGSSQLDNSVCNAPCEGDASDICGGGWALSIYSRTGKASVKSVKVRHALGHLRKHRRSHLL